MRSLRLAAAMVLLVALTGGPARAVDRAVEVLEGPTWYLALGDSLAAGYQPIGRPEDDHRTRSGYADQLWLMARARYPNLELRNLACPGESTETMRLSHDRCRYAAGSQLDEALAFIAAHPGELAFITIDIGFNDFDCSDALACLFPGIERIQARLPAILADLQAAAPGVPIVGMNVYDPFLTLWLGDEDERTLARQSVVAMQLINETIERAYEDADIPVADVEAAFDIDDWTLVPLAGHATVPRNLALLCERTWQCMPPPLGPDRHPNVLGFRVMADAFAAELGLSPT
ncbi:MAG TPA: SGNH/GDSL hydrolase family protein [Candidatus Deferrimicrobium sp.]|jgi:lysophospholipase L1-like esterase|nr:SGNH/GDSL hydrolase family protein [Candidatus Deferrimicrobium sp.]